MPPFPRPKFEYEYDLGRELTALRKYRQQKPGRQIPTKSNEALLLATWNVANLGVEDPLDSDYALIAEMILPQTDFERRNGRSWIRTTDLRLIRAAL